LDYYQGSISLHCSTSAQLCCVPFLGVSTVKGMTIAPVRQASGHSVIDFVFATSWNTLAVVCPSEEGNDRFTRDGFDWHCSVHIQPISSDMKPGGILAVNVVL
jgi:hypothetical protein